MPSLSGFPGQDLFGIWSKVYDPLYCEVKELIKDSFAILFCDLICILNQINSFIFFLFLKMYCFICPLILKYNSSCSYTNLKICTPLFSLLTFLPFRKLQTKLLFFKTLPLIHCAVTLECQVPVIGFNEKGNAVIYKKGRKIARFRILKQVRQLYARLSAMASEERTPLCGATEIIL